MIRSFSLIYLSVTWGFQGSDEFLQTALTIQLNTRIPFKNKIPALKKNQRKDNFFPGCKVQRLLENNSFG